MEAVATSAKSGKKFWLWLAIVVALVAACFILFDLIVRFILLNRPPTPQQGIASMMTKGPLSTAVLVYQLHNGVYPPDFLALMTKPASGAPNWRGPYLKEMALDPWGNPYQYTNPGIQNPTSFDVFSMGSDGVAGTADDIGNWPTVNTSNTQPDSKK